MENYISIILVLCATIINSIIFGYVASNTKNNKINTSYLIFLTFIILYTIFDCIIIQIFDSIETKDIIVKIQAVFWMPLSILFLNFVYLFIKKQKDTIYYFFIISSIGSTIFTVFSNKILLGYKDFNFGTMAKTGPEFLIITFLFILPAAIYSLYLIGRTGNIFLKDKSHEIYKDPYFLNQLRILFWGSSSCFIIAVSTNIFFDEILGYSGEIHLASLSLSIQSIFLLPALLKYNFLNKPMETIGDELYLHSSDAVFITNDNGIIINLNKAARKLFDLKGQIVNLHMKKLFDKGGSLLLIKNNMDAKTNTGHYVTIAQNPITRGNLPLGRIFVIRDVSIQKNVEEKLLKSEKAYKYFIESSSDVIYNVDLEGNFTFVNNVFEKMSGYISDDIIGTNSSKLVREDYRQKVYDTFSTLIPKKKGQLYNSIQMEAPVITKTGDRLWMELGVNTIVKANRITGFSVISRDITERKSAEKELQQITDTLMEAQSVAQIGNFEYNIENNTVIWSKQLYEIYGLDKNHFTLTNESFLNEVIHPDYKESTMELVESALHDKENLLDYFHKIIKTDGTEKWMHSIAKIDYDKKGKPIQISGTSQDITELRQYQEELRNLSSHIQNVQEEERGRIAHEIHDALGQRLTSISMDLAYLKSKAKKGTPKEITERLTALSDLAEETIHLTRKISQELRPSILDDLGLIPAIDWLKEQYNQRSDIHFTMDMPKNEIKIENDCSTAIFRITQEALTNIMRHSAAKNVNIKIATNKSNISLKIQDDGRGIIESDISANNNTFGVFGMKERASMLGGIMEIDSKQNNGTTIKVNLPLTSKRR